GQRGKRAEIEQFGGVEPQRVSRVECPFADDVELALERFEVADAGAARDKDLANGRDPAPCDLTTFAFHHRDRAPAQHALSFFLHDLFKAGFAGHAPFRVEREKDLADAIGTRLWEFETTLARLTSEKFVRNLHQDSRAVAGARIASASAAMGEIIEDLQSLAHDVVRAPAGHVHDKTYTTGVVIVRGIVQSLGARNAAAVVHGSTSASNR